MKFEVGEKYPVFKGEDGITFDITDKGAVMVVKFGNPTPKELSQFKSTAPFKIKLLVIEDVIFILVKLGSLNWIDAPYTVHLSDFKFLWPAEENEGLALNVFFADSATGELKNIRLVGLSNRLTNELHKAIRKQKVMPFDKIAYHNRVNELLNRYTTNDLVKMSNIY